MTETNLRAQLLTDLLIHLGRRSTAPDAASTMTAAQWSALRYFAHANDASRTPSAFARFHGTTRGTASQTVKSLVQQGLLERLSHPGDKRSVEFRLTPAGQSELEGDPAMRLVKAIHGLSEADQNGLLQNVQTLIETLNTPGNDIHGSHFGACNGCCHYQPGQEGNNSTCQASGTTLHPEDEQRICCQFQSN